MDDNPDALFDALLALRMEWHTIAEKYDSHSADLCSALVAPGRLPPGACRELLSDLMLHVVAYDQLTRCLEGVDELLQEAEDLRLRRYSFDAGHRPQAPPATGDESP